MTNQIRALAGFFAAFVLALSGLAYAGSAKAEGCVPSPETSRTVVVTPEQTVEHPAVTHEEQVFDHWQRYSWNGPWESNTEAPPFPDDRWQPNVQGDPHGVGVPGPYFRSHGNSGNGDWFYLEAVERTDTVVDSEAWTETIPAVTETVVTPAVTCPETPVETETPGTEGPVVPVDDATSAPEEVVVVEDDPVVTTETKSEPHKTVKIYTHESGKVTRVVKHYDEQAKEEGL